MTTYSMRTPITQAKAAKYPFHNPLAEVSAFVAVASLFIFFAMLFGIIPI